MEAILDTNFIISCTENKIDFIEEISFLGFRILVPKQVIAELEKISCSKEKKLKKRKAAEIALHILKKREFKEVDLGCAYVDKGIRRYVKDFPKIAVATLDRELKKLPNKKIIIRAKKKLEVV